MKKLALGLVALLQLFSLMGCGGGGGGSESTGPTITNALAQGQSTLNSSGGPVTIQANVNDSSGIGSVTAVITKPDGTRTSAMDLMLITGDLYRVIYTAPLNPTGQAQTYSVVITATDAGGKSSSASPVTFPVPPDSVPPPPTF